MTENTTPAADWTTMRRALAANTCKGRNGTYVCQRPEGHVGGHRHQFTDAGRVLRARWEGPHGEVKFTRVRPA